MLQFMDCSNCGKRVRTTAVQCHHCRQALVTTVGQNPRQPSQRGRRQPDSDAQVDGQSQSHHSLNGGYATDEDDFNYEEFLVDEFPDQTESRRWTIKPWVWGTAWVLIATILLPFIYYFINQ